jgi:hypothetical protein
MLKIEEARIRWDHHLVIMPFPKFLIVAGCWLAALPSPAAESTSLTDTAPVEREDASHVTIDAKRIPGPRSIRLRRCQDVVIRHCDLGSVELMECDRVVIEHCYLHDSPGNGVELGNCSEVLVRGCRIENVSTGVYAQESRKIRVEGNFVRNVTGPFPRGQMVQFNQVTGPGNAILNNYATNERGKSQPEDVISLYRSEGTPEEPILIAHNYLTGDPVHGSEDKSRSGSGIMLGDGGGAFQTCRNNIILSAGQAGIGVAGGHSLVIEDNLIVGTRSTVANVGLYLWNQSEGPGGRITVRRNRVHWINGEGTENPFWDGGGFAEVVEEENRFGDASLIQELPAPPPLPILPFRPES